MEGATLGEHICVREPCQSKVGDHAVPRHIRLYPNSFTPADLSAQQERITSTFADLRSRWMMGAGCDCMGSTQNEREA
jgi:hypothetical protein